MLLRLIGLLLGGCETLIHLLLEQIRIMLLLILTTPDPKQLRKVSGAIYSTETALPLFETPRARHPGDILTVFLIENTNAQKNANYHSKRKMIRNR